MSRKGKKIRKNEKGSFSVPKRIKVSSRILASLRGPNGVAMCVERNFNLLDLVHSDICEFNGMLTCGGNSYFINFINDCSRFTYIYLLKHKDEAFCIFKVFKAEVENQLGKKY